MRTLELVVIRTWFLINLGSVWVGLDQGWFLAAGCIGCVVNLTILTCSPSLSFTPYQESNLFTSVLQLFLCVEQL